MTDPTDRPERDSQPADTPPPDPDDSRFAPPDVPHDTAGDDLRDDFNVEDALAAVAGLQALVEEDDAQDVQQDEQEEADTQEQEAPAADDTAALDDPGVEAAADDAPALASPEEEAEAAVISADDPSPVVSQAATLEPIPIAQPVGLPHPPASLLERGQAASVVPALLLIVTGAALTFALANPQIVMNGPLLLTLVCVGGGLSPVARWVSSKRWDHGSLVIGLSLVIIGLAVLFYSQMTPADPALLLPLLLAAIGLACIIGAILSGGAVTRLGFIGWLLLAAGGGSLIVANDLLADLPPETMTIGASVVGLLALLILVLPVIRRRRE